MSWNEWTMLCTWQQLVASFGNTFSHEGNLLRLLSAGMHAVDAIKHTRATKKKTQTLSKQSCNYSDSFSFTFQPREKQWRRSTLILKPTSQTDRQTGRLTNWQTDLLPLSPLSRLRVDFIICSNFFFFLTFRLFELLDQKWLIERFEQSLTVEF